MTSHYVELLCVNGHRRTADVCDAVCLRHPKHLCSCGEQFVFSHDIEMLEGHPQGWPFEVAEDTKFERCSMGHLHVVEEKRYRIPQMELAS